MGDGGLSSVTATPLNNLSYHSRYFHIWCTVTLTSNSSSWSLWHRCIEMYGQQNIKKKLKRIAYPIMYICNTRIESHVKIILFNIVGFEAEVKTRSLSETSQKTCHWENLFGAVYGINRHVLWSYNRNAVEESLFLVVPHIIFTYRFVFVLNWSYKTGRQSDEKIMICYLEPPPPPVAPYWRGKKIYHLHSIYNPSFGSGVD